MLGRDEKNRIFCEYVGNEDDCPNTCLRCAVNVLEKGNEALSHGEVKEALRFYKRSAFIEPKYSDAWFHIGQTYRLMCEYNNALLALNKALSIDSQYGDALLEKANTLIQLERFEEAMTILNNIIELYDASSAHQLKEHLIKRGIKDTANKLSLSCAVDLMTEQAMNIIKESNLLNDKGRISTEKEIYCKEEFAARTVKLCRKVFLSFGEDKIQSESMLTAFYGSICTTLFYYDSPNDFEAIFPFDYLFSHVDVDKTEETAERLLGILSNETASEALWSVIYPFVQYSKGVIARIENEADRVSALIDATESVYMMGMLYAMRYHEQQAPCDAVSNIEQALEKLAQSSKEYDYTPPRRDAMCYSIAEPDGEFNFICARCGKHSSIRVYEDGGN
jgi:tetratricopeptide (TPR) repeat protein